MNSANRSIHIVGTNMLNNELMAFYIENQTGIECRISEVLHPLKVITDVDLNTRYLILFDCHGNVREKIKLQFESNMWKNLLDTYLVIFNISTEMDFENDALNNGVRGFLYEKDGADTLLKLIEAVFNGELWVSRMVLTEALLANRFMPLSIKKGLHGITSREAGILSLITMGHTNLEIADKLSISHHTVKSHIYHIYKKIRVSTRTQAAQWAVQNMSYT